jgi:hypothetical protein
MIRTDSIEGLKFNEIAEGIRSKSISVMRSSSDQRALFRAQAELDLLDQFTKAFFEEKQKKHEYKELR